jgi:hypothetical protein
LNNNLDPKDDDISKHKKISYFSEACDCHHLSIFNDRESKVVPYDKVQLWTEEEMALGEVIQGMVPNLHDIAFVRANQGTILSYLHLVTVTIYFSSNQKKAFVEIISNLRIQDRRLKS